MSSYWTLASCGTWDISIVDGSSRRVNEPDEFLPRRVLEPLVIFDVRFFFKFERATLLPVADTRAPGKSICVRRRGSNKRLIASNIIWFCSY